MAASYPKPDGQKVTRHAPQFSWVDLPEVWEAPAPDLPDWREWDSRTVAWWCEMWRSPQASQWKPDGSTMVPFALLMDDVVAGRVEIARASGEIRQHQDRHGLNPKAMLQLRWRLSSGEPSTPERPATKRKTDGRRKAALKLVGDA